jgi:predicted dienelactone hydrolase
MSENVFAVRVQWIMKRPVSHCTLLAAIATPFLALLLLPAGPCPAAQAGNSQPLALPAPTGPHPIGTAIFYLRDMSRKDPLAASSGRFRELAVQIWYPANRREGASAAPYIPDPALLTAMKKEQYLNLEPEVLDSWACLRTHSTPGAPILTSPRRLPLLLFSHGFSVSRSNYTSIVQDLASHGYILAAIDHPYVGLTVLPEGRVLSFTPEAGGPNPGAAARRVEAMAQDASFVLNALLDGKSEAGQFARRIDPNRVGMLGHSIGGAAALESCRTSTRFKACADLDGDAWGKVETEGVGQPFLVLLNEPAEAHRPPAAMREQRDKGWADLIAKKKTAAFIVKIGSTNHFSFSDVPFIVPEALMEKNGAFIKPQRGFEIITRVLRAFFSRYVCDREVEPLEVVTKDYPEVSLSVFNQ